jgi:hypothetical protein
MLALSLLRTYLRGKFSDLPIWLRHRVQTATTPPA